MICPFCKREVEINKTMCPHCGRPLPQEHVEQSQKQWMSHEQSYHRAFIVMSIIAAIIAIFFLPPLFGGFGFWCGMRVKKVNMALGSGLMLLNAACLVTGMIWGMVNYLT
jgi:predicted nucleic acid-binding Zn ribbon protein